MKLAGHRVKAIREATADAPSFPAGWSKILRYRSQAEIASVMRNIGLKGTQPQWVSQVERNLIDVPEDQATALAAALGVGLSEIMRTEDATRLLLLRLEQQVTTFGMDLERVRQSLRDPLRAVQ